MERVEKFSGKPEGVPVAEYGLLVGMIAVISVAVITLLGQDISSLFSRIAGAITSL